MRTLLLSMLCGGLILLVAGLRSDAQPPPPAQPPPVQPPPTQPPVTQPAAAQPPAQTPAPPPMQVPEAKKFDRDETATTIPFFLAGIAATVVMVLVCMPVRRE